MQSPSKFDDVTNLKTWKLMEIFHYYFCILTATGHFVQVSNTGSWSYGIIRLVTSCNPGIGEPILPAFAAPFSCAISQQLKAKHWRESFDQRSLGSCDNQ